jgi:hypothetical protein
MISNNHYLLSSTSTNYYFFIYILTNQTYYTNQLITYPIPISLPSGFTEPSGGFPYSSNNYTPQVILSQNFGKLIGFTSGTYPSVNQTTDYNVLGSIIPVITPINSIIITSSIINNDCANQSNILDTFPISNTSFGSNISYIPTYEKWISLKAGSFSSFDISFLDQNLNTIAANDNTVLISLLIRQIRLPKINTNLIENHYSNIQELKKLQNKPDYQQQQIQPKKIVLTSINDL